MLSTHRFGRARSTRPERKQTHELRLRSHCAFLERALEMRAHGVLADAQFPGELLDGETCEQRRGDIRLHWRELVQLLQGPRIDTLSSMRVVNRDEDERLGGDDVVECV